VKKRFKKLKLDAIMGDGEVNERALIKAAINDQD
jgi:hypothetical protein